MCGFAIAVSCPVDNERWPGYRRYILCLCLAVPRDTGSGRGT
jgi:hypothetical protein